MAGAPAGPLRPARRSDPRAVARRRARVNARDAATTARRLTTADPEPCPTTGAQARAGAGHSAGAAAPSRRCGGLGSGAGAEPASRPGPRCFRTAVRPESGGVRPPESGSAGPGNRRARADTRSGRTSGTAPRTAAPRTAAARTAEGSGSRARLAGTGAAVLAGTGSTRAAGDSVGASRHLAGVAGAERRTARVARPWCPVGPRVAGTSRADAAAGPRSGGPRRRTRAPPDLLRRRPR